MGDSHSYSSKAHSMHSWFQYAELAASPLFTCLKETQDTPTALVSRNLNEYDY